MRVTATQKGYYGGKIREPGETFSILDEAAFTTVWMQPAGGADPLDHDGDGRKGGSKPRRVSVETTIEPPAAPAKPTDPITGGQVAGNDDI